MKKIKTAEEIIMKLRKIETLINQGETILKSCREAGISDHTYYKWRKEYGGLNIDQVYVSQLFDWRQNTEDMAIEG